MSTPPLPGQLGLVTSIVKLTKAIEVANAVRLKGQRNVAEYGGYSAGGLKAQFTEQMGDLFRKMRISQGSAGTMQGVSESSQRLKNAMEPFQLAMINMMNKLSSKINSVAAAAVEKLGGVLPKGFLDAIGGGDDEQRRGPVNPFAGELYGLAGMAMPRQERRRGGGFHSVPPAAPRDDEKGGAVQFAPKLVKDEINKQLNLFKKGLNSAAGNRGAVAINGVMGGAFNAIGAAVAPAAPRDNLPPNVARRVMMARANRDRRWSDVVGRHGQAINVGVDRDTRMAEATRLAAARGPNAGRKGYKNSAELFREMNRKVKDAHGRMVSPREARQTEERLRTWRALAKMDVPRQSIEEKKKLIKGYQYEKGVLVNKSRRPSGITRDEKFQVDWMTDKIRRLQEEIQQLSEAMRQGMTNLQNNGMPVQPNLKGWAMTPGGNFVKKKI